MISFVKQLYNLGTKQDKSDLVVATLLKLISALFTSAPTVFLYLILLDLFDENIDVWKFVYLIIGVAACILLQSIFGYQAYRIYSSIQARIAGRIQNEIGDRIRKLSMGVFSEMNASTIDTIVTADVMKIDYMYAFPTIVDAISIPAFIALFLYFIDWRMAIATVAGIPLAISIYNWSQSRLKELTQLQAKSQIQSNLQIMEYIDGIGEIRGFDRTGMQFQKLAVAVKDSREANINLATKLAPADVAFNTALELGFAALLLSGTYLLLQGQLTVPVFLMFLVLGLRFYIPLQKIDELSRNQRQASEAIARISNLLEVQPLLEVKEDKTLEQFDIEFKNVSFSYEEIPVLQNISFTAKQGRVTALVGPSGSGKTTISNLIARFWDVSNGDILIGGVNVKDLKNDTLLSYISIVFQDVYLFNDTILNNIKFGNSNATQEQVEAAAKAARCHEFILELPDGYNTPVGEGGSALSGGEKQRISIARAILKDAPIVLLDEATASIDPENELLIQQAIDSLVQSKTLIVIAHKLSTIKNADQILVIEGGKIIERGNHGELIKNGNLYSRFWSDRQQARSWKIEV
ncbi:ABC transporter ATP-binding protein [Microcoleus sp. PH2017_30_WIL_O_A]|uniref:ABC transporter ATP-binding protein n=1 Tax=Microcoleus sp. PH2017_30_WIL_O_A TaxID=2798840 RepID=UPI001D392789|nr:ABC transporter ATP-binding protein [Microcoleus sp. PH2017_30_WIL_O_A]MCC3583529.1 ABC transporter ATP-binding protein [Microcoleus sp. PH2017_30_WIL_O_A]